MSASTIHAGSLSPWRVEWLRVWRTKRLVGLLFVYAFFGFADPLLARYMAKIIGSATNSSQIRITVAEPVPADGMVGYMGSAMQIGLLVGLAMLVSACAIDASYPLAIFYRTRRRDLWTLLVPRVTVSLATMTFGFALGMAAAWYETAVLIGTPSFAGTMRLLAAGFCYQLAFGGVAFLLTAILRSVGTTTAIAIVLVLVSSVLTTWPSVARWSPVGLTDYAGIYAGTTGLRTAIVASLVIAAVAIGAGMTIAQRRQLTR
jgi:ABC-2 type transport system permease protein